MGEYKVIKKSVAKVLRHLLNSQSTDTSREILCSIHIDKESGYACTTNGFMLTFVDYLTSGLDWLGLESDNYSIRMGKLQKDTIIEITKLDEKYPKIISVLHAATSKPVITFSLDPHLLKSIIAEIDGPVIFSVWDKTQTVEMSYKINSQPAYTALMPMHTPDLETERWKPKEKKEENEQPKTEK